MHREKLLTAAIYIERVRQSSSRSHEYRIRTASKIRALVDDFIAVEVQTAVSKPKDDSSYMSWQKIADTLGISKTAAYTRYGPKRDN